MSTHQRLDPRPRFYRFADHTFHSGSGELAGRDGRLRLARQPALVLQALLERPGEVVTRAELIRAVWNEGVHVDYDQSLNFCIREIRRALGDGAREPRFVETLPKRGYRFLAPVMRESANGNGTRADQSGEPAQAHETSSGGGRRARGRAWVLAAAMGGALLAGAALGHDAALSPTHERAVSWFHSMLGWTADTCLWGGR